MTTYDDVNSFLLSGGAPAVKFPSIGTTVTGTVVDAQVQQQTSMEDGAPLTWNDGRPKMQLVITLATDLRDADVDDDDGKRRLFAKGHMLTAIREAVKKSGAKGILPGGTLTVRYDADGEPTKRGYNPPKLYKAKYTPGVEIPEDEEEPF